MQRTLIGDPIMVHVGYFLLGSNKLSRTGTKSTIALRQNNTATQQAHTTENFAHFNPAIYFVSHRMATPLSVQCSGFCTERNFRGKI